jgi:hypothetical protein
MVTVYINYRGTRWRSWLGHYTTSRKAAGSIPDGVIEIFHWHNTSGRTMALGSTQPLTKMSTRNISWGVKAACALGWKPYRLYVPIALHSESFNLLEPSGPVQACKGIALSFTVIIDVDTLSFRHRWVKYVYASGAYSNGNKF